MIFSVQNSNLMYSVEFSPDLVQIQVREAVSGVFLAQLHISIQMWQMLELMQGEFNEHHMMQVPITENELQMMEKASEHVGMNYPETPGFSETMTPLAPQLPPARGPGSALRSIENLRNSTAARQLFDLTFLVNK